jgi:hypothetical protein
MNAANSLRNRTSEYQQWRRDTPGDQRFPTIAASSADRQAANGERDDAKERDPRQVRDIAKF